MQDTTSVPKQTSLSPRRAFAAPEPSRPELRIVRLSELAVEDRDWTRGHAHIGFDDYPTGAPGRLDDPSIKLAVLQTVDPGHGYPMHPHANVETVTLLLEGTFSHEDSVGNRELVGPGGASVLSAGRGIQHAEMVHGSVPVRAVMFWLVPTQKDTDPRFVRGAFAPEIRENRWVALASGRSDAPAGALPLLSDTTVLAAHLSAGSAVLHGLEGSRRAYVLSTDAPVTVNGRRMEAGERALAQGPGELAIRAEGETELVLVDVP